MNEFIKEEEKKKPKKKKKKSSKKNTKLIEIQNIRSNKRSKNDNTVDNNESNIDDLLRLNVLSKYSLKNNNNSNNNNNNK